MTNRTYPLPLPIQKTRLFQFGLAAMCLLHTVVLAAQAPGGLSTNLKLWLKADNNITVSAGTVPRWDNNVTPDVTGYFSPANPYFASPVQTAPTYSSNGFNYNPGVLFDGITQSLESSKNFFGSNLLDPNNNTVFQVFYQYGTGLVWMKWESDVSGIHRIGFERNGSFARTDFPTTTLGLGINTSSTVDISNKLSLLTLITDNLNNTNRIQGINAATQSILLSGGFTDGGIKGYLSIGNNSSSNLPTRIDMSEIIFYNRKLSATELNMVESYLAVKNGITLGTSYVSTAGTSIYNNTAPYTADIIGIGRDDAEALLQKQSHTRDDSVRLYLGSLGASNATNASGISADQSYIMMGSNNGRLYSTSAALSESPPSCLLVGRLEREWKISNSNFTQPFKMDIKLSSKANPGSINVADLRLLVDDDGNFGNGGTTCYRNGDGSGIVITYANPVISISGISTTQIPVNASRYVTVGATGTTILLPVQLLAFNANCGAPAGSAQVTWSVAKDAAPGNFELQRSEDGTNFHTVSASAAIITDADQVHYTVVDRNASPLPSAFYRLRQVQPDGPYRYSNVISWQNHCSNASNDAMNGVYPNPLVGHTVFIRCHAGFAEQVHLHLTNIFGQPVAEKLVSMAAGSSTISWTLPDLPAGIYFLVTDSRQRIRQPQKLLLQ